MRPGVVGIVIGVILVGFVTVWVYLASRGMVPSVGGQLQNLSWPLRVIGLLLLVALLFVAFVQTKRR